MVVFCILHRRMYCATPADLERCCLPLCAVQSVSPSKRSILVRRDGHCVHLDQSHFQGHRNAAHSTAARSLQATCLRVLDDLSAISCERRAVSLCSGW